MSMLFRVLVTSNKALFANFDPNKEGSNAVQPVNHHRIVRRRNVEAWYMAEIDDRSSASTFVDAASDGYLQLSRIGAKIGEWAGNSGED